LSESAADHAQPKEATRGCTTGRWLCQQRDDPNSGVPALLIGGGTVVVILIICVFAP